MVAQADKSPDWLSRRSDNVSCRTACRGLRSIPDGCDVDTVDFFAGEPDCSVPP